MAKPKRICSVPDCVRPYLAKNFCRYHYDRNREWGTPLAPLRQAAKGTVLNWMRDHVSYASDDCLFYHGFNLEHGRPTIAWKGRKIIASRAMCILAHGQPPEEKYQAAHSCGKGHLGCMNPKHLRWATVLENSHDRILHGTMPDPVRLRPKLTPLDVSYIRNSLDTIVTMSERLGVSKAAVTAAKYRHSWKRLP